jgi:hypothetical protein
MTDFTSSDVAVGTHARSAVSWGAILGGAVASAAISLMLLTAGTGLGLTTISPWQNSGVSATTFGISAVLMLALIQILAMGFGGYLAGRLRTKSVGPHTREIAFRDTAHGFLTWALGSMVGAILLASTASSIIGGTARLGASAVSGLGSAVSGVAGQAAGQAAGRVDMNDLRDFNPSAYLTDTLFRSDRPAPTGDNGASRAEVGRIVANSLRNGDMVAADRSYVATVIANQTGLSQADAEKRVNDTIQQAKDTATKAEQTARETAEQARIAGYRIALATFIAMLIGAMAASMGATMGGKARDRA